MKKALACQRSLAGDFPGVANYRYDVVRSLHRLARVTEATNGADEAEKWLRKAAAIGEEFERNTQEVRFYREKLVAVYADLVNLFVHSGRAQRRASFSEKIAAMAFDKDHPSSAALAAMATEFAFTGRFDKAAVWLDRSLELDASNHFVCQLDASVHAAAADAQGYRPRLHAILQRFGDTDDPTTAERHR